MPAASEPPALRGIVIYNPTAGRGRAGRLQAAARVRLGNQFAWRPTQHPGHAVELATVAAAGSELVIACGGDGTVSDVARGVLAANQAGRNCTLGLLPFGTGNDIARNLQLPLDLAPACDLLLNHNVRRIDTGLVNDVPFLNNAGIGFDAAVMRTMNHSIRFLRGSPAFVLATLTTLPRFQPFELSLAIDDQPPRTLHAMMVAVLNGPRFAAGMQAAPAAVVDDGRLDLMVIRAASRWKLLSLLPQVMRGRHVGHPLVELSTFQRLELRSNPAQPINRDGDLLEGESVRIACRSASLAVAIPRSS